VQTTLLGPNPDPDLRVYAVWFNMYPSDTRQRWRDSLLTDPRVRQYWDEQRGVGRLYLQTLPAIWPRRSADTRLSNTDALWDAYLLYERDAYWGDAPPDVISWGSPIIGATETLHNDLERAVAQPAKR
jgi:hypothetical protein